MISAQVGYSLMMELMYVELILIQIILDLIAGQLITNRLVVKIMVIIVIRPLVMVASINQYLYALLMIILHVMKIKDNFVELQT